MVPSDQGGKGGDTCVPANDTNEHGNLEAKVPELNANDPAQKVLKLKKRRQLLQDSFKFLCTRIFDLESTYLEETTNGNIIKGWDVDGRPAPLYRSKANFDEKERLFSCSSHRYLADRKAQLEEAAQEKAAPRAASMASQKKQRGRKRKAQDMDDWATAVVDDY